MFYDLGPLLDWGGFLDSGITQIEKTTTMPYRIFAEYGKDLALPYGNAQQYQITRSLPYSNAPVLNKTHQLLYSDALAHQINSSIIYSINSNVQTDILFNYAITDIIELSKTTRMAYSIKTTLNPRIINPVVVVS